MKYQFFGDTHGETHWKDLLDTSCVQVFLGDYFSPYKLWTQTDCLNNFLEILELKKNKPETVLLYGNHDFDILYTEGYSRLDFKNIKFNRQLFQENSDKFQIAFSVGDYLVTHAGVSTFWKELYLPDICNTPKDIATAINNLWLSMKSTPFDFNSNCAPHDNYGYSPTHGPLWIRWDTLRKCNVFKDLPYKQIVGH